MRALCEFFYKLFTKDFLLYYIIFWTLKAINSIEALEIKTSYRNDNSNYYLNWLNFIIFKLKIPLYTILKTDSIKGLIYFHSEYTIWFILFWVTLSYNFKTSEFAWWLLVEFPDILYNWKMKYLKLKSYIKWYRLEQYPVTKRAYITMFKKDKLKMFIKIRKLFRLLKKRKKLLFGNTYRYIKNILKKLKYTKNQTLKRLKKNIKAIKKYYKRTCNYLWNLSPKTTALLILLIYFIFIIIVIYIVLWISINVG